MHFVSYTHMTNSAAKGNELMFMVRARAYDEFLVCSPVSVY
jgi:hypothetical protein